MRLVAALSEACEDLRELLGEEFIAVFGVPSWSHDPSPELRELREQMPEAVRALLDELADIAEELAPEQGRTTYGGPTRGLTPWDIYSEGDARRALERARRDLADARVILKALGQEPPS